MERRKGSGFVGTRVLEIGNRERVRKGYSKRSGVAFFWRVGKEAKAKGKEREKREIGKEAAV